MVMDEKYLIKEVLTCNLTFQAFVFHQTRERKMHRENKIVNEKKIERNKETKIKE